MDSTALVSAASERTRYVVPAMRGFWFVRPIGYDKHGRRLHEIAHTRRDDVIALTDPCSVGHAARVANTMNRLDRNDDAPRFDERTGEPIAE